MRESKLERDCRLHVERRSGRLPKWTSPGDWGVPDRILLLPGYPVVFIEFKKPGETKKLRPAQRRWRGWLARTGFNVVVINDYEEFTRLVREIPWN